MVLLAPDQVREIVRGEFWGDGHYSNKYYEYKTKMHSNYFTTRTTSRELAMQMHYMLGRLGILSSISTEKQKDRKLCYSVTVHTPYVEKMGQLVEVPAKNNEVSHSYIHISDGMIVSPVVKMETQEVVDYLTLNLEVEGDHSYVAANIAVHNCVFCGLCVDACPFDALYMTNDYELSAYDKSALKYTPDMLAVPPKLEGKKYKVEFDTEKGVVKYG
jgi:ferredoxin